MEKINKSLSKEYLPVVLFIEDLESLVEALSINDNQVTLATEEYKFTSVAELEKHFGVQRPRQITINSTKPYGSIELTPLWTRIYIGDSSVQGSGIFYKLDKILTECQRKPAFGYSYYFVWSLNIVVPLANHFIFHSSYSSVIWLPWLVWVFLTRLSGHSTIILRRRSETPSFIKRNSDQIITALVAAIVGAIIAAAATKFIDNSTLFEKPSAVHMDDKKQKELPAQRTGN